MTTPTCAFDAHQISELSAHLDEHGYVVVGGVVDDESCTRLTDAFQREVKPFRGRAYRQTTATPDRNTFTEEGYLANPLLNVQTMPRRRVRGFLDETWNVLGHPRLQEVVTGILGSPGMVVQTFYFEGNPTTAPHHDAYYLDPRLLTSMMGAWIALEDIEPSAGRFFVCPGSHRIELPTNSGAFEVMAHHDAYLARIREVIAATPLIRRAPALARGDVLFWLGTTIHGTFPPSPPARSRQSLNAHIVPRSTPIAPAGGSRFGLRDTFRSVDFRELNGVRVHRPVGLSRLRRHGPTLVRTVLRDRRARGL